MRRSRPIILGSILNMLAALALAQVPVAPERMIFKTDPDNCVTVEKSDIGRYRSGEMTEDGLFVEFRLANGCRTEIYYLSKLYYLEPYGFLIYRDDAGNWRSDTPHWGRGFTGFEYRWRPLKPGEAVCTQFSGSLKKEPTVSTALYYGYSRTPAPEAMIEIRAPSVTIGPAASLPMKTFRTIAEMIPNCEKVTGAGYLLGSIDRFKLTEDRSGITIVLEFDGGEITLVTDSYGEFSPKLPVGKYRLLRVIGKDGKPRRPKKKKNRFEIRESMVTEWYVDLREQK